VRLDHLLSKELSLVSDETATELITDARPCPLFRFEGAAPRAGTADIVCSLSRTLRTAERARASLVVLPSYKEPTVDALASRTDEGRERLRKATGSCLLSTDP
jgi:hypothetical protein